VSLEITIQLSQSDEIAAVNESRLSPRGIQQWCRVSFRQDETIIVIALGLRRIKTHMAKKQCGYNIRS
jgi:hypothetical protein